jgi:hypothetical protein
MKAVRGLIIIIPLCVGLSGCVFGNGKAARVVPPAVVPRQAPPAAPTPVDATAIGNLPAPAAAPPDQNAPVLATPTLPPPKPQAPPQPQRPVQARTPPPAPEPAPAAVSVPQLGEILTADQRRQMQTEMADHLARARDILTKASKVNLKGSEAETRDRVRIFIKQAEDSRERDPATALQLANRADVLAQDLEAALH